MAHRRIFADGTARGHEPFQIAHRHRRNLHGCRGKRAHRCRRTDTRMPARDTRAGDRGLGRSSDTEGTALTICFFLHGAAGAKGLAPAHRSRPPESTPPACAMAESPKRAVRSALCDYRASRKFSALPHRGPAHADVFRIHASHVLRSSSGSGRCCRDWCGHHRHCDSLVPRASGDEGRAVREGSGGGRAVEPELGLGPSAGARPGRVADHDGVEPHLAQPGHGNRREGPRLFRRRLHVPCGDGESDRQVRAVARPREAVPARYPNAVPGGGTQGGSGTVRTVARRDDHSERRVGGAVERGAGRSHAPRSASEYRSPRTARCAPWRWGPVGFEASSPRGARCGRTGWCSPAVHGRRTLPGMRVSICRSSSCDPPQDAPTRRRT